MKRLLSLLFAAVWILGACTAPVMASGEPADPYDAATTEAPAAEPQAPAVDGADSGTNGSNITWTFSDKGVLTISGTGRIEPLSGTDWQYAWDAYRDKTTGIVISEGITDVGDFTFKDFSAATLTLPASLRYVGVSAFEGTMLRSVQGAYDWAHISRSEGNIPLTLAYYGQISDTFGSSGTWLITKDGSLTLGIRGSLTDEDMPWSRLRYRITDVTLQDGVTGIGPNVLAGCTRLKTLTIPKSLRTIDALAFDGCGTVTDIYYDGTADDWALVEADRSTGPLSEAVIHYSDGTTSADPDDTSSETDPPEEDPDPPEEDPDPSEEDHDPPEEDPDIGQPDESEISWAVSDDGTLTVTGTGAIPSYETGSSEGQMTVSSPWFSQRGSITKIVVENGITSIGANAFRGLGMVTEVSLPDSLRSIGDNAFFACLELHRITLPKQLESIGSFAFNWCELTENVVFPSTLQSIGERAFGSNAFTGVDLPGSLKTVGQSAFGDNDTITELTIRSDLTLETDIGGELGAFSTLYALETVHVAEGVLKLPRLCFSHCWALKTIELPSTIEILGHDFVLFYGLGGEETIAELEQVTAAPRDEFILAGWYDEDGRVFTPEELTAKPRITYTGDLRPMWIREWTDEKFTDVKTSDWYYDAVCAAYQSGLMNGMSENTFVPGGTGTRAQVVTILWRLAGEPAPAGSGAFPDVPDNTWYSDAVAWAAENGITRGYEDGTFRPMRAVTRQEFVQFLLNMAVWMGIAAADDPWEDSYTADFPDAGDVAGWARAAENWSVGVGLQNGSADSSGKIWLAPKRNVSRAELATFLVNFAGGLDDILEKDIAHYEANIGPYPIIIQPKAAAREMIGADLNDLIAVIGEPASAAYTESCLVLGGEDGLLAYEGFTVQTIRYPTGMERVVDVF